MNIMVDVSVIIVNWNARDYLLKCLKSLGDSTKKCNIEIIVVDNNSSDGSVEAVRNNIKEVKLIVNNENLGFAKANNIGIEQSKGRYVCLVNSDIKVLDGCIDLMCDFMDDNAKTGLLGPKTLNSDMSLRKNCQRFPTLWSLFCRSLFLHKAFTKSKIFSSGIMTEFAHDSVVDCEVLPGCFLMARREALKEVGLLDESLFIYAEDKDWCKRFWDTGWKVSFLPKAKAIHYAGVSSSNAPARFIVEKLKADFFYWKKHHSKPSQILFLIIMSVHHLVRILGWSITYVVKPTIRQKLNNSIKGSSECVRWIFNRAKRK